MRTSIFAHYLNKSNEEEHPNNSACSIAALLVWRIQQIAEKHRLRIQVRSGKNYFAKGQYNRAATLLNELIAILKGTDKAEESLYMLGMSYYNQRIIRLLRRLSFNTTTFIPAAHSLNWHVFMPVKLYIWILRSRVWTNPVRIAPSSSCRCLWNTSRKVPRKKKRRT